MKLTELSQLDMLPMIKNQEDKNNLEILCMLNDVQPQNRIKFLQKLIPLVPQLSTKRLIELPGHDLPFYKPTNPSIISNPDVPGEFIVNVRHVNYHCNEQNEYHCNNSDEKIVHTKQVLYFLDKNLNIKRKLPLTESTSFLRYPSPVQDLEDLRFASMNTTNSLVATCTSREYMANTMPQQMLVTVRLESKQITGGTRLLCHLENQQGACQKNWLPFFHHQTKQLCAIYANGPSFIVYDLNIITGKPTVMYDYPTRLAFDYVRGGSPPVPFMHNRLPTVSFIVAIHYAYDQPRIRRIYFHRFLFLDEAYKPVAITESFTLLRPHSIEFILSMVPSGHHSVYIGFGHNDVEAYIAEVDDKVISELVYYDI